MFTSTALIAAAIAGFFGLVIGSLPPNDPDAGAKLDGTGALLWAIAAAAIVGGLTEGLSSGSWTTALTTIVIGFLVAGSRMASTRPAEIPTSLILQNGINRPQGATQAEKMKNAERMFRKASIRRNNYFATRSPREYRYGAQGATAADLELIGSSLPFASPDTFGTLVLLVSELPGLPGEPAVIVAQTDESMTVDKTGVDIPGVGFFKPATISASVGYAWR